MISIRVKRLLAAALLALFCLAGIMFLTACSRNNKIEEHTGYSEEADDGFGSEVSM